jgi:hypothetical protein
LEPHEQHYEVRGNKDATFVGVAKPGTRRLLTKQQHGELEQEEKNFDWINHEQDAPWCIETTDRPMSMIRASCKLMINGKVLPSIETNTLKGIAKA